VELPSYLQLEPVGQCNLRCQMCPIQYRTDAPADGAPAFMPFERFRSIVDQFPDLEHLHLQGMGEPMLHPRFFDMVEYAVTRRVRVTTNSNLTVLSPRRAERCVSSGLGIVHVSIDAASPDAYARIRVGSRLERVERNFGFLREAREQTGADHPTLKVVMVVMRQNLAELPKLVRMAARWGCSAVSVQHLCHDFGESTLPAQYQSMRDFITDQTLVTEDPRLVAEHFDAAREAAAQAGVERRLPRIEPKEHAPGTPGRKRCNWPWTGACVSYQGYSMPCCMISTPDRLAFGNMAERPVAEVWNSSEYENFRARLSSSSPPEVCGSCSIYKGIF
jgi:radical SAM protein with 4Fe4S-binding SPASM domain